MRTIESPTIADRLIGTAIMLLIAVAALAVFVGVSFILVKR